MLKMQKQEKHKKPKNAKGQKVEIIEIRGYPKIDIFLGVKNRHLIYSLSQTTYPFNNHAQPHDP